MDIVSKMLPPAVAIEYLTDTLSQIEVAGADVTRVLLSGSMSALVPDSTPDNRVCDFKHGGILAPIDDLSIAVQKKVQPVANAAEVLAKQLVQFDGLECLIHDPLKKIGEAAMADGVPILVEGSLFYLNMQCFQSVAECQKVVRRNTLSWHFLMLIGRYPNPENLSRKSIVLGAACIVVGAYDGESYLVWRPD
jgi:hypothetical protein